MRQEMGLQTFSCDSVVPERASSNYVRVHDFSALVDYPPFFVAKVAKVEQAVVERPLQANEPEEAVIPVQAAGERPLHVYLDFDGVVSMPFSLYDIQRDGLRRMYALRRVAEKAAFITIWSGRFAPDEESVMWRGGLRSVFDPLAGGRRRVSRFPFFTAGSQHLLTKLIHKANSGCVVSYSLGSEKMLRRGFASAALKLLQEGNRVAVVGSSVFDRRNMRDLTQAVNETEASQGLSSRLYYFDTNHVLL